MSLKQIAPTVDSVNDLQAEDDRVEFIKSFRELIRLKVVLACFTEFDFEHLKMGEQELEDYQSQIP